VLKADSLLLSSAKVKNEWSYTSIPINIWRAPNLGTGTTFLSEFSGEIFGNIFQSDRIGYRPKRELMNCGCFCDQKKVHESEKLLHLITDYFVEGM
jgi:hypothetical protein